MMMMMMMMMACRRMNSFFVERLSMASFLLLLLLLLLLPRISCIAAAGLQSSTGNSQSTLQRIPLSSPASSLIEPKTQSFAGNVSLSKKEKKTKSFENSASSKETSDDEPGQMSKVTKTDEESGNTSSVDRNGTLSAEMENQTTAHSTPTPRQLMSKATEGSRDRIQLHPTNGSGEVKAKVKVKSDPKQTTDSATATTCCGALTSDSQTTAAAAVDEYNYNEYDNDDNDEADTGDDDENDRGELEEADDNNYERNVYGYNDSSDGKQALGDYREEDAVDASKPEYVYATDNVTSNETEIPSNQDQPDLNSDPSYYYSQEAASAGGGDAGDWTPWRASGPSADGGDNEGHSLGGSPPLYEAGSRDYHFGTKHRSFDMYLGQKISEMRSGSYHGRPSLSLRWLGHRQINHFAIFLWLLAALVVVGLAITAYRFRHSVYNAIQSTRTNYKQGRRIGIEEANDLLSHAQV